MDGAHLGIIGNVYEVVPKLISKIKKIVGI